MVVGGAKRRLTITNTYTEVGVSLALIALLSECESPSQEKTLLNSAFFFAVGAGKLDLKKMGER